MTNKKSPQVSSPHIGKKFAVFDIDGTLFRSGLYREVAFELVRMGAIPESILKKIADKENAWKKRSHGSAFGEFDQAVVDALDNELPRLKVAYFDLAAEKVINKHRDNVYVYTRDLVKKLKTEGRFMLAISGSQREVVGPFAEHYGFDYWVGQTFERGDEFFTGHVRKTHEGKGKHLKRLIKKYSLSMEDSIAVGDSAGDIEMLSMVERPIAFNPESNLYAVAKEHNWSIVIERKNMIYRLEHDNGEYRLHQADSH
jgi:HAD superfamily hydrolase (TIGR01490 family)